MDTATVNVYDGHAAEYARRYAEADVAALQQLLVRYLVPGSRVLEIGCGSGRDAAFLAARGFAVTATDASAEMLAVARRALATPTSRSSAGDAQPPATRWLQVAFPLPAGAAPLGESFAAVVALAVVMHIPDQELFEFAFQVRSLLEKGGTLIVTASTGRQGLNAAGRDGQGRLFRERPAGELRLLFERLGFRFMAQHDADDGLGRPEVRWFTLVFRLDSTGGDRPVDQIETIINRDQSEGLEPAAASLADAALNQIANTIVVGPVTFATQGDFSFCGRRTARHQCHTPTGIVTALGRIHFRADAWREMCLLGHWIGEAIILRWAELTHEISARQVPVALVLERLLAHPETERSVYASRDLFRTVTGLTCVWTRNPLSPQRFDVDHVIPFALWHNNDLWNLVPADARANNEKRDRLVTRDLLAASRDRIIDCWKLQRNRMPQRFDVELSRTLLGRNQAEPQWEMTAFAALVEAVETLALQRGVERWEPGMATRARQRRPAAESAPTPAATSPVPAQAEKMASLPFADLSADEPFRTALPVVATLAAGPLSAGFEAGTLDAWAEFDWIRVPPELAHPKRFVVRIAGDSMEPTISQGDLVVFEYHRNLRDAGRIVIVADFQGDSDAGECAVKRLWAEGDGLWIVSDNPAYLPQRVVESAERYPILGGAVWNLTQGRACR